MYTVIMPEENNAMKQKRLSVNSPLCNTDTLSVTVGIPLPSGVGLRGQRGLTMKGPT